MRTTTHLNSIRVANAPCSWGALEFDLPGQALGYATVLDEIRQTGYQGTELGDWGFMPTEPDALRRELDARGLKLVGAFVPIAFARAEAIEEGQSRALRTASLMAATATGDAFLVLADDNGKDKTRTKLAGRIQSANSLAQEQCIAYGRRVNQVAEKVRSATGLRTVFHHHCAGFVETPWEIEALLENTDPALVGLCFDTGHYRFGGGREPVKLLQRFRDRIWHVHFKDCSAAALQQSRAGEWDYFESLRQGVFCELGQGDVPFDAVLDELAQADYRGWIVVEQDILPGMGRPKEYAARNREFLRQRGL